MSNNDTIKGAAPSQEAPISVVELGTCSKTAWEAFVLFGAGRMDELKTISRKAKESGSATGYSFLLGLARIEGEQGVFEDTAVDFAVQFGQSPPAWFDGHTRKKDPNAGQIELVIESFSIDTIIEVTVKMESPRPLKIDLSRVSKVDAQGMDLFSEALSGRISRCEKTKIVNGDKLVESLIEKLSSVGGKPPKALWSFCFDYFRLNGMKARHDQAAVTYIGLGGTKPEWVDLSEPEADDKTATAFDGWQAGERIRSLSLTAAKTFLATPKGAEAKAAGMLQIDFSLTSAGSLTDAMEFMDVIRFFDQQKIRLSLVNVNEIFLAMFNALGLANMVDSISTPAG